MSNPTDPRSKLIEILSEARAELTFTLYQPETERLISPSQFRDLERLLIDLRYTRDDLNRKSDPPIAT